MSASPDITWEHLKDDLVESVLVEAKRQTAKPYTGDNILRQEECHMLACLFQQQYETRDALKVSDGSITL